MSVATIRESLRCITCMCLFDSERLLGELRPSECVSCRLKPERLDVWLTPVVKEKKS